MLRALLLAAHLVYGVGLVAYVTFGGARRTPRERLTQGWNWRLLAILGVRLQMEGTPLRGAHLTVANHVSWLDIPVLAALEPTRFVSKSEVRYWPLAGWFATAAGTFFIRRGKGGAARLLEKLVPHPCAGGCAVLFPEGTTTDGTEVRPFHPRLFQAAIDAQCAVQPVTLQYSLAPDGRNVAPFIGNDLLGAHLLRLLRTPALEVRVSYGPPIRPTTGRDELALEAHAFVRSAMHPLTCLWPVSPPARLSWLRA